MPKRGRFAVVIVHIKWVCIKVVVNACLTEHCVVWRFHDVSRLRSSTSARCETNGRLTTEAERGTEWWQAQGWFPSQHMCTVDSRLRLSEELSGGKLKVGFHLNKCYCQSCCKVQNVEFSNHQSEWMQTWCPRVVLTGIVRHQMVPVCFQHWSAADRCQPLLTSTIQARRLSLFGHIAQLDDSADTKKILTAFPPEDWKRLPSCPRITWIKTVLNDLESHNLTFTEAVNMD